MCIPRVAMPRNPSLAYDCRTWTQVYERAPEARRGVAQPWHAQNSRSKPRVESRKVGLFLPSLSTKPHANSASSMINTSLQTRQFCSLSTRYLEYEVCACHGCLAACYANSPRAWTCLLIHSLDAGGGSRFGNRNTPNPHPCGMMRRPGHSELSNRCLESEACTPYDY